LTVDEELAIPDKRLSEIALVDMVSTPGSEIGLAYQLCPDIGTNPKNSSAARKKRLSREVPVE
jgi:hypothetical protein